RRIADHDGDRPRGIILRHRRHGRDRDGKRQRTRNDANERRHANVLPPAAVRTAVIAVSTALVGCGLDRAQQYYRRKPQWKKPEAAVAPVSDRKRSARTKPWGYWCQLGSQPHLGRAQDPDLFRGVEPLARQVDSKRIGQAYLSPRGQPQRAAVALAHEPTQTQAAPPDLRAHKTRDMKSALAPVETGPAEDAFAACAQVRTEFGQKARARIRHLAPVLGEDDVSVGDERIGDGDADLAGQVIVAGAREAKLVIPNRTRLIARRHLDRRDGDDAFEHPRDQRRSDAIVAIAPLLGDGDEARLDELEEVLAGGRTRDAGGIGKFASCPRLAAPQRSQD